MALSKNVIFRYNKRKMTHKVPQEAEGSNDEAIVGLARVSVEEVLKRAGSKLEGLSSDEVPHRRALFGMNEIKKTPKRHALWRFLLQFGNPLVALLMIIGIFSMSFGDSLSAAMVWLMACLSVFLSFVQEHRADNAVEKLRAMVRTTVRVRRDAQEVEIPIRELVPGDLVVLQAGDLVPADLRIVRSKDLALNQSSLTGESLPVDKHAHSEVKTDSLIDQVTLALLGTSVVSGNGEAVVLRTGDATSLGKLSHHLDQPSSHSSFDEGIRRLTWLILRVIAALVVIIFVARSFEAGSVVESLLFSLAVAVGLTPDMLPMIVTITLSRGALDMAKKNVIVKHLPAIQDFGAMDILCTDKTGTLTLDQVVLEKYCDLEGKENEEVLRYAYINSAFQSGLRGLLDRTILEHRKVPIDDCTKVDEVPFDFERRIISVVAHCNDRRVIIAKGAPESIITRCTHYVLNGSVHPVQQNHVNALLKEEEELSSQGFRVLAVAYRELPYEIRPYTKDDECELTLCGYLAFLDPPKPSAQATIASLQHLGVHVKVLTGDNPTVTAKICKDVGLAVDKPLTGIDVEKMNDAELAAAAQTTSVFARLSPLQKERIVKALRSQGHVVGYLGDGINDAPSLKAADIGISVQNAVDIAKESADVILLEKSLQVLREGILEGRRIFQNIQKYVRMGLSSNFGNMFSMTGAALIFPFLPMLPLQILLNNFLYNFSQLTISTDDVDTDELQKPHPWDIHSLQRFMLVFGPLSSLFDFMTFGMLIYFFHADSSLFQTSWFLTSLCTQTLVIHVIRTEKIPFLQSSPSSLLFFSSFALTALGFLLPVLPVASVFGFVQVPTEMLLTLIGVVFLYLCTVQVVKMRFVKKFGYA